MADDKESQRKSTRVRVPPSRFPNPDPMTTRKDKSRSKSVKSNSTVRKAEIQFEADEELLDIQDNLKAKETELRLAELKVNSIQRKLDHLGGSGTSADEDSKKEADELLRSLFDAQDNAEALKIEFEALKATSEGKIHLVNQKKNLELEKVDSEDEVVSSDSEMERNKSEYVGKWVNQQTDIQTPAFKRVTVDATTSKVTPQVTPTGPEIAKRPVYAYQKQMKSQTGSFDHSSDEVDFKDNLASRQSENDQVTMRDLVNALSQFGGNNRSQVVMKTTVDKDLPKFGGEPENWIQFKSEYDRTSQKYGFDESENMIRLRKALVGQAKNTVQHLMVNVKNVPVIMDSLEKRFGRPRLVLNALSTKAKSCSNVTTAKPETIIEFGLAVQALVSNIVSFSEEGYLNSVELLDALVKKLSPDLATRWYEWLAADKSRIDNLLGFSEWSSMQLDIAYQRVDFKTEDHTEEKTERRRKRGPGFINVVTVEDGNCPCCGKGKHTLDKCWSFQKKSVDDRWKIVKSSKACISCLKLGHRSKECKDYKPCEARGCSRFHHKFLHSDRKPEEPKSTRKQEPERNLVEPEPVDAEGNVRLEGNIAVITGCDGPMPIVPVKLRGPNGSVKCHALLDTAASRSLIKKEIAALLGLDGDPVCYSYQGVTGTKVTDSAAKRVTCEVSGVLRGCEFKHLRAAVTVDDIKMQPYSINMEEIKRKWPYLSSVAAKSLERVVPDIIIGNNNPHLILARKIVQRDDDEPVGWRTELGWTVSGNFDSCGIGAVNMICGDGITNEYLHTLIKQSFSFEDFGVRIPKLKGKNLDEKRAYRILERTKKLKDNCWETGLLWKTDEVEFPESESAALKRLEYVERRMKNPNFKKMYADKIDEYLTKGYLRKLTSQEAASKTKKTYVIPHFGLTNPNKPGKFRFILDAKAKSNGVSLNDMLLKGPDLIRSLVGLLWSFRIHQIALTGDISDWFHRIKVPEEDADSQRLLWRNGDPRKEAEHYMLVVLMFGATSSPASAIYVKNKNADRFQETYPHAVHVVKSDFFFDDCLTGVNTVEEVILLRKQLTKISSAGNFNLCKWMSNSKEVLASIPAELRADGVKNFEDKDDLPGERVLGMWWDPQDDVFQFKLGLHKVKPSILEGEVPTKREMCGVIMSLFDPIGFISHYKIKGLILLQDVWNHGIGWDDQIPASSYSKWKSWLSRLEDIKEVRIPRCYSKHLVDAQNIQIHTFVDASSEAYSCISYLRIEHLGTVEVVVLGAKARVAPLKKTTIPRLELQAALLGARLVASLQDELKLNITRRYFWSDSNTVLLWMRSRAGKMKEFVANRIGEIQEITNPDEWYWIPTKLNIADIATRFESDISFSPDCEWFQGPAYLRGDQCEWNFAEQRKIENSDSVLAAVVGDSPRTTNDQRGLRQIGGGVKSLKEVIPDPSRFSSYLRLVRATTAVKRAALFWLSKIKKTDEQPPWRPVDADKRSPLFKLKYYSDFAPFDLQESEKRLARLAQEDEFTSELNIIRNGGQPGKKGNLWRLSPVLGEDGLLRVDGRIGAANGVPMEAKYPVILPPRHRVTELIVDMEHRNNAHQGVETVLCNLRRRYWIIDGRHTVKRSWSRCQVCHLAKCKPLTPRMGSLPPFRLASNQPPFTFSGIDLFGPMEVSVGRHHEKRWGVLICCMVTRAVNLDIVYNLSTDEIMMALSRFIDVRGRPSIIHSDNGTNFVGAAKELRESWTKIDFSRIQECGKFQEIKWTFNLPAAPHMGGIWERLIQTVKKCLAVTLHEKYPKDTTLLTVFKSVENMMNSRPLTHSSGDTTDPEPITPNHILRGSCDVGPSIPAYINSDEFLRTQWKRSQILSDQFWQHWTKFYLPKLVQREKWRQPEKSIQVGALVFLVDDLLPRNCWVRGYVSRVFPGKDGVVRVVDVTTRDAITKKTSIYRRPVAKVCPLGLMMEIKEPADP